MRLGIISDVHANTPALSTILDFLDEKKVDRIVHAGDVIGYNPFPAEVIEMFKKNGILSIAGNHDRGATGRENPVWFNVEACEVLAWTVKAIGKDGVAYLSSLKPREHFKADGKSVVIIHGHPEDDNKYTYEGEADESLLDDAGADILILGHTHVPFVKRLENGIILNPGSVGQPRDGNWKASCAVLDVVNGDAALFRLDYPVDKTADAIYKAGLPARFAERLKVGR